MELTKEEQKIFKEKLYITFKAFDKFCKDNNIRYCAAAGTLLGAVRHNAIIPWDDDIDVCMCRPDYEHFLSLKSTLVDTQYRIIDIEDKNYYLTFAKFYDANSSIWEMKEIPCIYGVYIDIFVIDVAYGTYDEILSNIRKCHKLSNNYLLSCISRSWNKIFKMLLIGRVDKFCWYVWQKYLRTQQDCIKKEMDKICKSKGSVSDKWMVSYLGQAEESAIYPFDMFDNLISCKFNDTEIPIPSKYDEYLKQMYGDYMKLPPKEKQVTHHLHFYFNPNRLVTVEEALKPLSQ